VTYEVTCASGEVMTFQGTVLVPHDHQGITEPLTLSVENLAGGTYVGWNEVPGAVSYNVVRGDAGHLHEAGDSIVLGPLTCVQADSIGTDTGSSLDASLPASGELFFYLVEYTNASGLRSSYGTETLTKPRVKSSGGCP